MLDATHGYDAMWLAARTLNATENVTNFRSLNRILQFNITSNLFNYATGDRFTGASVRDLNE